MRLLRAREALGISQEQLADKLGCSKRALGSIERGQVRDIGLEALEYLLEGQSHAATWEKPRGGKYLSSHQTKPSDSDARGGRYAKEKDSVAGGGAETSALMPSAQESGPRAKERWRSNPQIGVAQPGSASGITPEVARSNRVTDPKRRAA